MGWPDGHTIVGNWNGKGNPSVDARYHAPDELAGRPHDRGGVVQSLDTKRGGPDDNEAQAGHLIATFVKHRRAGEDDPSPESWGESSVAPTVDSAGHGPRTATAVLGGGVSDDPMLPVGLDSNRYRCCGNGVVADVAFWIGQRLAEIA